MTTIESLFALAGLGPHYDRLPTFARRNQASGFPADGSGTRLLGLVDEMFGRLVLSMPIASGCPPWR